MNEEEGLGWFEHLNTPFIHLWEMSYEAIRLLGYEAIRLLGYEAMSYVMYRVMLNAILFILLWYNVNSSFIILHKYSIQNPRYLNVNEFNIIHSIDFLDWGRHFNLKRTRRVEKMEGEGAHNTQNTKQNTIHNTHFVIIIIIAFKSLEIKNLHFDRRERAKTKPKPKPTSCYSGLNI